MALNKPENATAVRIVLRELTGLEFEAVEHEHGIYYEYRDGRRVDILITPSGAGWAWHDQDGRCARGRDLKELVGNVGKLLVESFGEEGTPWGVQVGLVGVAVDPRLALDEGYAPLFINDEQARFLRRIIRHYVTTRPDVAESEVRFRSLLDERIQHVRRSMKR